MCWGRAQPTGGTSSCVGDGGEWRVLEAGRWWQRGLGEGGAGASWRPAMAARAGAAIDAQRKKIRFSTDRWDLQ